MGANQGEILWHACRIAVIFKSFAAEILLHSARANQWDVLLLLLSFIAPLPTTQGQNLSHSMSMTGPKWDTPLVIVLAAYLARCLQHPTKRICGFFLALYALLQPPRVERGQREEQAVAIVINLGEVSVPLVTSQRAKIPIRHVWSKSNFKSGCVNSRGELLMCWRQMLENDDKVIKQLYCSQSVTYLTMTAAKVSRPISMSRQHGLLVKWFDFPEDYK